LTNEQNPDAGASKVSGCCGGGHDHASHEHLVTVKVRDPVCGMSVDPATSRHRFDFSGETWHFCCAGCRTKFAADPQKYLDKRERKQAAPEGAI
jgi:Cu+-exporting ATPase